MNVNKIIKKITGKEILDYNSSYIDNWLGWFTGNVKSFHEYKIYNGKKHVEVKRFTLNMAKRACEDWANLLLNEKTDITIDNKHSQEVLHKTLEDCHFWQKGNEGIEKSFALGIGMFVVTVDDLEVNGQGKIVNNSKTKVKVKFVNGTKIKPITFEDEMITECAFINVNSDYTYISIHLKNEIGNYEIHNITCKGKDDNLSFDEESYTIFDTKNSLPWFFQIKPNITNNIDINSPLGISIFANAIDNLKEIDLIFDSFAIEFILGRKRIFIEADSDWAIDTETGEPKNVFDANELAYFILKTNGTNIDGKTPITIYSPDLRIPDHITALQNHLSLYGYKCGFGTEHFKFENGNVYSNQLQVISVNSDMFKNLRKHEILLEDTLKGLVKTMLYAINTFTSENVDENAKIAIKFDDSIIIDSETEREKDLADVNLGVMSKYEYRMKWYAEDEKTAREKVDEANEFYIPENPSSK